MNVLFVVPYVPSLVRVRPFNLIRSLGERGHRVTVLTLAVTADDREDADRLAALCASVRCLPMPRVRSLWNSLRTLPTAAPLQSAYSWQPDLAAELAALTAAARTNGKGNGRGFDVVHVEHLRGARYALMARRLNGQGARAGVPVVWDSVDCISHLFRQAASRSQSLTGRLMTRLDLSRTERYEAELVRTLDHILVTSPRDKAALLGLLSPEETMRRNTAVTVIPNGVDLAYFQPAPAQERDPATLVVSGKMSYHANVAMVLHLANAIMPLVWARRPDVQLQIVGKDPGSEIRALAQHPQVTVTGTVADIRPYLWRATAAIAPLTYGAGVQNKVLEAMACATPVVTSSVALSSLTAVAGRDLLVADTPAEFAENIMTLLANPAGAADVGSHGRCFVETHHNWNHIAGRLEAVYAQASAHERQQRVRA